MEEPRRGRGPSPQKTAETQARVVNAALARFLSDGFERTRMLDVARDAGLAKGTLYLYFPTKEALFEGVVSLMLGGAVQRLEVEPPGPEEPTRDFVRRALMPLVMDEQAKLRQALFRLILTEGQRFPEVLAAYRKVALDPVLAAARRIGSRARARGEIGSDALERLPMLLLAPGLLVSIWNHMFPGEALDPLDVFTSYFDLLFDAAGETPFAG
jgi:TetR/AcrR family transcriptional regulator, regulator of autoinduction and epiphytic fitness